jgi:hypothetical protein
MSHTVRALTGRLLSRVAARLLPWSHTDGHERRERVVTTETRCDCCDLPAYSCGRAADTRQQATRRRKRQQLLDRGWFPAQWPGTCEGCAERFAPGDLIRMHVPDGWRSECCS